VDVYTKDEQMKIFIAIALLLSALNVSAKTCDGKITEINHWSDGLENRVNFKLKGTEGTMWLQTATKEHVSMVLMSLASKMNTRVYWSCNAPASCSESQSQNICGHLTLINE